MPAVLALKLIPILWSIVLLCNLFTKKLAPELMTWYPVYSIIIGLLTTAFLLYLAA